MTIIIYGLGKPYEPPCNSVGAEIVNETIIGIPSARNLSDLSPVCARCLAKTAGFTILKHSSEAPICQLRQGCVKNTLL